MGLETAIILGATLLSADASVRQSEAEAQAVIDEANIQSENRARQIRQSAATQRVSFLNSGLTLEGTPLAAINNTFDTGIQDLNQISKNANTRASNIIDASRAQTLGTLASGIGGSFAAGDLFSTNGALGTQGAASRAIEFGNTQAQGPIQGFGGFGDFGG